MKIFTVKSGEVTEGARVDSFTLNGAGVTIPAILVGEEGRGRKLGVLPVGLLPDTYTEWEKEGHVYINFAKIGTTKAGKPKLFQTENADTLEKCICVFRTMIGFRGGNSHTGDRKGEYWTPNWFLGREYLKEKYTKDEAVKIAEELNYSWDVAFSRKLEFHPFPGGILCEGVIAQGDAGRMGWGMQLVAVMPANIVFRTGYSGRLYGAPSAHYYIYRNGQLLSATWQEREVADIF